MNCYHHYHHQCYVTTTSTATTTPTPIEKPVGQALCLGYFNHHPHFIDGNTGTEELGQTYNMW